jgi:hypothetical protein
MLNDIVEQMHQRNGLGLQGFRSPDIAKYSDCLPLLAFQVIAISPAR